MATTNRLEDYTVAILVTDGFEQVELTETRKALHEAGAKTEIVSPKPDTVQGMNHSDKGDTFKVDVPLERANVAHFDALLLPGGVANPDRLRMNKKAVEFVRAFFDGGKPIAAICHAPWMLIETGIAKGYRLTSFPSLQTDVRNAGGDWVDEASVTDRQITTSRRPDDIPEFNKAMLHLFEESVTRGEERAHAGSAS